MAVYCKGDTGGQGIFAGIRGYAMGPVLHTVDMGTRFNILAADYWLHSSLTAYELYFKMP